VAVVLNACHHEGSFAGIKEAPRFCGEFGKVYDEEIPCDAEDAGDESFDLED
jgi:hypothetical protein